MTPQTNILRYRFSLALSEAKPIVYDTEIRPIYKKDLALTYEQESEGQFFRNKLSSKITLIGSDYEKVMALPFSATRHILLEISFDNGKTYKEAYGFKFVITDCEVDEDKKTIEVQPSPDDAYDSALNGWEKEYDLIKDLKPEIKSVKIAKRGMLQVYIPGEPGITCFFNGLTWTQQVDEQIWDANALMRTYGFGQVYSRQYRLTFDVEGLGSYWALSYKDEITDDDKLYLNGALASGTYISVSRRGSLPTNITYTVTLYNVREGVATPSLSAYLRGINAYKRPFSLGSYTVTFSTTESQVELYARWVQDKETFGTTTAKAIPKDDFVGYNRNYKYCLAFDSVSNNSIEMIVLSRASSEDPTGFAKLADGRYAIKPESAAADFYPLYEGYWGDYSMWLRYDLSYEVVDEESRKWYDMTMGYPLYSVINELLKKIAPDITHKNTAEYSEVLYGQPLTEAGMYELILTPKTNITVSDFSEPAMKGPISLKDILDMLIKVYKIYWFIDNGKLRLERLDWFKNGGSYEADTRTVGLDLTKAIEPFNNKPWSYYTASYSFNKDQIPGQIKFTWMDDVTEYFTGYDIDVDTPLATKDNIEEVQINKFTTDIDYMLLNTEEISKDGFALLAAVQEPLTGDFSTMLFAINRPMFSNVRKFAQNGQLGFMHLLGQVTPRPTIIHGWPDDMPSHTLTIKGETIGATSVRRIKTQDVIIPLNSDVLSLNAFNLVHTSLGDGIVDKISIELASGVASITLLYDTPI